MVEIVERLLARVEVNPDSGCWEWRGALTWGGYGRIGGRVNGKRKTLLTHRVAYAEMVTPIPDGLQIDHLCRVRHCCNPDHLEPVTPRENTRRAPHIAKAECKRGHSYAQHGHVDKTGRRHCRECHNAMERAARAAKNG